MCAEKRRATIRNQRLVVLLIVTMVPAFSILDYFAYPEHFRTFAYLRVACVLITIGVHFAMGTQWARTNYGIFTVILPVIPAFFISGMVFVSQDPGSPYYAGLTLCIVAVGFVFHWTYKEAFISTGTIGLMFLLASAPLALNGMDQKTVANFFNNCIFVAAKSIVIVAGCYVHHQFRVNEYILRERSRQQKTKLRAQRLELQNALRELSETEGQLIQSEKMASLGQLSAGVIHEIGNPLNYSNQALFLLRRLLSRNDSNPQVDEAIEDIQDSIDRMKEIVSELREFSHKSSEIRIEYSVRDSVDVALRMLGKEIEDSRTTIHVEVDQKIRIEGVKNQLTQVFINLIQNAIQAMEERHGNRRNYIDICAYENEDFVEIAVRDSGPGIPEEIRNRIFDPFFTTKEVGEGTGLGLSICFRIVEAHGGTIRIESQPDGFTCFVISLPRIPEPEQEFIAFPETTTLKPNEAAAS